MQALAGLGSMGMGGASAGISMDPRLGPAAHEFEACLMKEFLKPLQKDPLFDDGKGGGDGSDNALMSFGSEALARAISDRGGFGIATRIIEQLQGKTSAGQESAQSGNSLRTGGEK